MKKLIILCFWLSPLGFSLVGGCGSSGSNSINNSVASSSPDISPSLSGTWYRPSFSTTWQWQLLVDASHPLNTSYNVELYDIDLFDSNAQTIADLHAAGRKVICYFSAGSYENWRSDASQFPASTLGNELNGWAGERWLDIRSASVEQIMQARLDMAQSKGCDGVEPDNVDGYQNNTGFPLTAQEQLNYNAFIANEAHARGLSVGLKNDLDQVSALLDYFDFSLDEQCHEYSECDLLQPFIDAAKPVFNAEYSNAYVNDSSALCSSARAQNMRTLVLPLALDDSFRISCD